MTRMKYRKVSDNQLIAEGLLGSDDIYSVKVDLSQLRYVILGSKGTKKRVGNAITKDYLLKAVKDELKSLNVKFSDEIRKRPSRKKEDLYDDADDALLDELLVSGLWNGSEG